MMQAFGRRPRGAVLVCVVLWTAMAPAEASSISARDSSFQACLDGRFEKWVDARAELVANEDAKAGDVDDARVAQWAAETMTVCRAQVGGGDQAVEQKFAKRMANWRQHIYDRAQSIRELARPD